MNENRIVFIITFAAYIVAMAAMWYLNVEYDRTILDYIPNLIEGSF